MTNDFSIRPSQDMFEDWQYNYEFFNERLFDFELSNCLITLQRRNGTFGYFSAETFHSKDGKFTDEIALNPSLYNPDYPIGMLSTLVHEMVHLWQFHFGTPGRGRYHNREWADKMIALGLHPSVTGKPGGRETGDSMHHYIVPDGAFERAATEIMTSRDIVTWTECLPESTNNSVALLNTGTISAETETTAPDDSHDPAVAELPVSRNGKKFRFECPEFELCKTSAEGKYDTRITCTEHQLEMVMVPRKKRNPGEGLPMYAVNEH